MASFSSSSSSSLVFNVTRKEPELITPAKPTPNEFKTLSGIDDQGSFRFQIPFIQYYRNNVYIEGRVDPVDAIRKAIANALVFYYPFAGRIREGPKRKLIVDCTGEGVMFIEAKADIRFDQFGSSTALLPPCPWLDELLYEVPGSGGILDCPLLLIQVTRLLCGGFVFAIRLNHTMADGGGLVHFMNAVAEMARGGAGTSIPSIQPVWKRELLNARVPPRVTCLHRGYDPLPHTKTKLNVAAHCSPLDYRSFFFGPQELAALRKHLPSHLHTCSTVEILIACSWRCRTIALSPHPEDEVRLICNVNARGKYNPPLPMGFYGNAFACSVAFTSAGELCRNPMGYALELVKKAKESVTDEYMRSLVDMFVIRNRPEVELQMTRTYLVSDVTRVGFENVDFGWGKAVYGGPAEGGIRPHPGIVSMFTRFKNDRGENGILVPVCLPGGATMEKFGMEVRRLMMKESVLVGSRHFTTKL